MILQRMQEELSSLRKKHNFRILPSIHHEGRVIQLEGRQMLNLSSNDYLGLATDRDLREEFLATLTPEHFLPSSSSSRLLTGNYEACEELENRLTKLYGTESALVFSSGYHANTGILPAIADSKTLILADKWVHASIIDGIRLSSASCIRYRHNHYEQLERLLKENSSRYETVIIVTESIFSMDGDEADLSRIVSLKEHYPNLLLYVDSLSSPKKDVSSTNEPVIFLCSFFLLFRYSFRSLIKVIILLSLVFSSSRNFAFLLSNIRYSSSYSVFVSNSICFSILSN